jgi:hypothetical protein
MAEEPDQKPTQHTPKGAEIPVPSRRDVFRDLGKVAKPRKPKRSDPEQQDQSSD